MLSTVLLSCNRDNDETKSTAHKIKKVIAASIAHSTSSF